LRRRRDRREIEERGVAEAPAREDNGMTMSERKIAFVTGASRGIGKVLAIWLARAGFDVAITARTVAAGEQREHSPSVRSSDTSPLPGSLGETAAEIERAGARALLLGADITDLASVEAAATGALERWGRVDVLVNCARHTGPGHMDRILDTPMWAIGAVMQGNFFTPLLLTKLFLPGMLARGYGIVINFTSVSAVSSPAKAAGEGGWGITYGATKSAMHRLAGILAVETEGQGILSFNVDPGYTWTERIAQDMSKFGFVADGAPPEVSAAVVNWLVTNPEAAAFNGRTIFAQPFCAERGLLEGWTPDKVRPLRATLDRAASSLAEGKSVSD
jgi:NAD(P)-dependent dehydrogenase (short-subunit alcohol dehydrogenase family)